MHLKYVTINMDTALQTLNVKDSFLTVCRRSMSLELNRPSVITIKKRITKNSPVAAMACYRTQLLNDVSPLAIEME
jgi:hypothetical protein